MCRRTKVNQEVTSYCVLFPYKAIGLSMNSYMYIVVCSPGKLALLGFYSTSRKVKDGK